MAVAAQTARRRADRAFKRAAILDAAKRVFAESGLEGASLRLIAREAGYTPGAIYYHYPDKEHVYGDVLADSLAALGRAIKRAAAAAATPAERVRAAAGAFYEFYRDRPQDLDLSFYLYRGIRPRGLTRELDRQLNGRLIAALSAIADALRAAGALDPAAANLETVAVACHLSGVLLLENSGRLKVLGFQAQALVDHYLDGLDLRLAARPG